MSPHISTCLNYAFLTPEVDDDGSETEECLTEEEHAVELALRHPSKFSESMAIERPSWVGLGGTKPSHSVGESSSASFDDAERSTPQDTASDSRTQPGLGLSFSLLLIVTKPGATDILERLQRDQDYMLKITPVPRARICLIRSEIKERCNTITMGVFLGFDTALDIVEYVRSQLSQYTYTFLRANNCQRTRDALAAISKPPHHYCYPGYVLYRRLNHEVPVPMVALVATALYATIYEWRTGEQQVTEFSANAYLDVYHGNVNTLTHIRENREGAFHLMMADIYRQANTPTGNEPSSGVPIAELDLNQLDG
ncbi:hypothetical protein BJY52DRAFT_1194439 [Lactarius psammicola]|nr:hypothetical protein BJY52DRAFT_1194439 [Lactarius psammicola]